MFLTSITGNKDILENMCRYALSLGICLYCKKELTSTRHLVLFFLSNWKSPASLSQPCALHDHQAPHQEQVSMSRQEIYKLLGIHCILAIVVSSARENRVSINPITVGNPEMWQPAR